MARLRFDKHVSGGFNVLRNDGEIIGVIGKGGWFQNDAENVLDAAELREIADFIDKQRELDNREAYTNEVSPL